MKRYWFKFDITKNCLSTYPQYSGLSLGCGVTAYNLTDAKKLLQEKIFTNAPFPEILEIIEDIDVSTLDNLHILPNVGVSSRRGVWFPNIGQV